MDEEGLWMAVRRIPQQPRRRKPAAGERSGSTPDNESHAFGAPLSGARERQLIAASDDGDAGATAELVDAFMPAIDSVARNYRGFASLDQAEFRQEGVVGLLRAAKRYDQRRRTPFWAYASWWVRQAMQQVVSELSRPMVLSDRALRQLARVKQAQRAFEQARRREATTAEVSTIVGLPQTQVEKLLCTERTARGLDEPTGAEGGDGTTVGELLADPPAREAYERVPQQLLAAQVPALLGHLSERERTVICSRYGLGQREQTLREIAPRLGVSAERVRQIEQESLAKLYTAVAPAPIASMG
jgi:RNA polymerase sigma factor (sigma-70 family)